MRVCDKCGLKTYGTVVIGHQEYDMCHGHYQDLMEFLSKSEEDPRVIERLLRPEEKPKDGIKITGDPPKRRGRPPKNSGTLPDSPP